MLLNPNHYIRAMFILLNCKENIAAGPDFKLNFPLKGTLWLFGTLAYSSYPPELDKAIHVWLTTASLA